MYCLLVIILLCMVLLMQSWLASNQVQCSATRSSYWLLRFVRFFYWYLIVLLLYRHLYVRMSQLFVENQHSQLEIRTANFIQKIIASENSLCYIFALTACRKLNEVFAQFHNATRAVFVGRMPAIFPVTGFSHPRWFYTAHPRLGCICSPSLHVNTSKMSAH